MDNRSDNTSNIAAAFVDVSLWHGSLGQSQEILAAHPEISGSDIYVAAVLGDDVAVRKFIAKDPACATAKGGPRGWDPLTYLCFSKYLRLDSSRSDGFVRAATALLDAGADANTGFNSPEHQPHPTKESVLYGAAGVAHHPEMTRLLLERGADPNDGEVPYHSPETLDNRALKILVESGKLTLESIVTMLHRKFDWHDDDGVKWLLDRGADPNFLSAWGHRALDHALSRCNPLRFFEWLLDHGANPALEDKHGANAFTVAARFGRADVLDLFARRGFPVELASDDAFLSACAHADETAARTFIANDPEIVQRLQSQNPALLIEFAGAGKAAPVRVMLDLGFDVAIARTTPPWSAGETALHCAAWRGRLEVVKLLIERGAPLEAKNHSGATPMDLALRALLDPSEWSPNRYTLDIARLLAAAGARINAGKLNLNATQEEVVASLRTLSKQSEGA